MTRAILLLSVLSSAAAQPLITTVAGTDFVFRGDGLPALKAPTGQIAGLTLDAAGNIYFVDINNQMVMKVTADGTLHVLAGNGFAGFSGDGGPATIASIDSVGGLAVDRAGAVYLADTYNSRIRKISPDGTISTVVGSRTCADAAPATGCYGGDGGPAVEALLATPTSVKFDAAGNLYIIDYAGNRIRKVSPAGIISTFAGNGTDAGGEDGSPATEASLNLPIDAAFDPAGGLWVLQSGRISRVNPDGTITGGALPNAFTGIAIDRKGDIYLADWADEQILRIPLVGDLTVVAGAGKAGFSGDGGPATEAQLALAIFVLAGLAFDSEGNLYIADLDNFRIRKISSDGIIRTVSGNGQYGYSGDGGPAVQATFTLPSNVTFDAAGAMYVVDAGGNRVRKIAPDGLVSTVAGSGSPGFAGDGGPALEAALYSPLAAGLDATGSIYILDALSRVRRVTPDGIIRTFAGNGGGFAGKLGDQFSGDTGPALEADLGSPLGVLGMAVAPSGTVYIAETINKRIRKVTPDGTISTVARDLTQPMGLALDAGGNLYVADAGFGVRKITPAGTITTVADLKEATAVTVDRAGNLFVTSGQQVFHLAPGGALTVAAGNGKKGNTGDGGPAVDATLNITILSGGVAADAQGNLYIADGGNRRIRKVLAAPPSVRSDVSSLVFAANATGAPAPAQQFNVVGSIPLIGLALSAATADGGDWLSVSAPGGLTPLLVDVTADPSKLAPGSYQGIITVTAANALPGQFRINVAFTVGPALPARLMLDQDHLSFAFPQGAFTRTQSVAVLNQGGGALAFTAAVTLDSGGPRNWLTLGQASGVATPSTPIALSATANAEGLAAGTYGGRIVVTSTLPPSTVTIPVSLTVSTKPLSILLSQSGLSFTAVAGGGVVPPQSFGVLSVGAGASPFTVEASSLSGGNWLSLSPASGTLEGGGGTAPLVTVNVNQQGLAPGRYYGLIRTRARDAANTPQVLTTFLDVQASDTDLAAVIRPGELVFTAPAGESGPSAQEVLIYNLTGSAKSFLSVPSVSGGDPLFFRTIPGDGVIQPDTPARILVQPNLGVIGLGTNLQPGTHRGSLTLQFSDGRVRTLGITLLVTPPGTGVSARKGGASADAGCSPSALLPAISSLGGGFSVPAGWPMALQVDVRDNCGTPLEDGSVVAEFSSGDPPLSLKPITNGRWDATWQTRGGQGSGVTITVKARSRQGNISGVKQVAGGLGANQLPPVIAPGGVVNTANPAPQQPVAPGSIISILGDQLSEGQSTYSTVPLDTQLAGTTVLIGDRLMPLLMADPQQINAIVPYGIEANATHQVLVQRGLTYSRPVEVVVAAAQPYIFEKGVLDSNGNPIAAGNAARSGDSISILCSGLGEVAIPIPAGSFGTPAAVTSNPVTVTIGDANAPVRSAGLLPGMIGVYRVQATVPAAIPAGPAPLTVTVQTAPPRSSQPVTIAVQ
ncbi:MAG TPA: hypothetical protein VL285_24190 [Bryobacteraceae bacterium]|nr:hypothetical protein [Bryobacteraceae bacterium]